MSNARKINQKPQEKQTVSGLLRKFSCFAAAEEKGKDNAKDNAKAQPQIWVDVFGDKSPTSASFDKTPNGTIKADFFPQSPASVREPGSPVEEKPVQSIDGISLTVGPLR